MITDIPNKAIRLEDFLNTHSTLPMPLQDTLKKECGSLILVDDMLQLKNCGPQVRKMAHNLLKMESDIHIKIEPSNYQKSIKFIEKMISEAKKSPSRYALELSASLNNLIDEFFSNRFVSESSYVYTTFIRNFQRFSRYFLELKLNGAQE